MTPEAMAALHRATSAGTRAWSAAEYAQLSSAKHALIMTCDHGFVLGQLIGDEAEIFMIIVDPAHQRRGLGLAYLTQFEARVRSAAGASCFLEVATSNLAAQALYNRSGYQQVGTRENYYKSPQAAPEDALVLRKIFAS
ncbi:GNAT family N-acetyltransferase [Rhodobacteraceae bacterium nBUS_24]|nr:GNAT family N-acetyltransferase [Marinovum sp.]